jgi:membrane-associated protein
VNLDEALRFLVDVEPWVTIAILFAAALIEYVFPPFPGDTVTLAGAVLVAAYGFPLVPMFLAVLAGGLVGAAADYALGRYLAGATGSRLASLPIARSAMGGMERVAAAFARHGEAYIAVNRFLPGIRAFLFVAAGLARMRPVRVMLFAGLSSIAWNALVVAAGMAVGARLDALETLFRRYSLLAWSAIFVVAIVVAVRAWRRRRKERG